MKPVEQFLFCSVEKYFLRWRQHLAVANNMKLVEQFCSVLLKSTF